MWEIFIFRNFTDLCSNMLIDMYKKETTNTTNTMYEPEPVPAPVPDPTTNTYYKYSSQTTTNRNEPRMAPFPIEGIQQPTQVDGTPKHLNQLLASFDDVSDENPL